MNASINGVVQKLPEQTTITTLLLLRQLEPSRVVIEINLTIIDRSKWDEIILNPNDQIEIVSFVGGG